MGKKSRRGALVQTNFLQTLAMGATVLYVGGLVGQAQAGLFDKVRSPEVCGKLTNHTSIPNDQIVLAISYRSFRPFSLGPLWIHFPVLWRRVHEKAHAQRAGKRTLGDHIRRLVPAHNR